MAVTAVSELVTEVSEKVSWGVAHTTVPPNHGAAERDER
jgi:hypothetical protein